MASEMIRDGGLPRGGAPRPCRGSPAPTPDELLPETEALDELVVALRALAPEVLQQPPPPPDHLQQSAPRMVVLGVGLEVLGQVRDAGRQERDLDLRRARVGVVGPVVFDDVRLAGLEFGNVHSGSKRLKTLTLFSISRRDYHR